MWAGKAFFSAFPWSTVSVLILSLSLRESKFTLSWLLRNTQQDISAWWVRKLWNEGRDRSLQKKVPCLYLLVCNSRLQCPWGCIDKAECRTCTVLRVSWVQPAATGKPRNSSHICYPGCGITQLAPCAVIMGIVVRLPRAKVSTPCVCGGGHAWEEPGPCICLLLSTRPLWGTLTPVCANFCFETPLFCHSGARADSHLHRNLCEQQALAFITEVPADKKKRSSAFILLCNRGFIPQRPSPADKNKTLHANGYFCHHP